MELVLLIAGIAAAWVMLALFVAVVVGRVVRRGDEDARILGSMVLTASAHVGSSADPWASGASPVES